MVSHPRVCRHVDGPHGAPPVPQYVPVQQDGPIKEDAPPTDAPPAAQQAIGSGTWLLPRWRDLSH
ncbi:hypothetical protein A2U01_0057278, partial [Trifolium medium]|nr:hypothetical protein [Trifolium medium]